MDKTEISGGMLWTQGFLKGNALQQRQIVC